MEIHLNALIFATFVLRLWGFLPFLKQEEVDEIKPLMNIRSKAHAMYLVIAGVGILLGGAVSVPGLWMDAYHFRWLFLVVVIAEISAIAALPVGLLKKTTVDVIRRDVQKCVDGAILALVFL
ncbi:MAG: hypothetical protein KF712_18405 [Akkermansiaceae bacterium]|nr:hypothetical protein [Akkermansiaceae bacterium]